MRKISRTLAWLVVTAVLAAVLGLLFGANVEKAPESSAVMSGESPDPAQTTRTAQAATGIATPGRAWNTVDPDQVERLPPYKETVPGRRLVRIADSIQNWKEGDEVSFEVKQLGRTLDGLVEQVKADGWGNRSYVGSIKEPGTRSYRFLVTVGARNTFAYLDTPQGTFELVALNDLGWLMPTAGMDQHVDFSRPDIIGPEAERYRRPR